ncbi:NF-X1 finger and helicase domain protein [Penicillium odoratum]|uniref:NF-X1 finger and helicase domain protein n=1 Tax=Penicillium odoratum TaxID=1167516 RepID=UPI0025472C4C|nr:NF-X1 finger and helicase domain protein [Penicillium odoratum]KAJ5760745.1 NF-X1 finger and helicase domain protein [Penicillium odoratum]
MGSASKYVDESKPRAHTVVYQPATAMNNVHHAIPNVKSPADTQNARRSVSNPVLLAHKTFVSLHAHTADALCPVLPHVTMFLAPFVCGEKCPTSSYCQICATYNIKNQDVDYLEGATYKDINLDENPCIFPTCGHFLTMESMDAQMDLKRHYQVNKDGKPTAILASSQPFSMEDIKTCGICRGPLRNIARYGRLVRRALLDESTKKLILRLNQEFIPLAQKLAQEIQKLQGTHIPELGRLPEVEISGRSSGQIKVMKMIMDSAKPQRWENMIKLREQIMKYLRDVNPEEQPFQRVREMVVNAQRHKTTSGDFTFGDEILQTKGVLQAAALSLRLDIALLADFLDLERLTKYKEAALKIDLRVLRNDCDILVRQAQASHRPVHETEGWIFKAQLYALERGYVSEELGNDHLQNGRLCIYAAKKLCQEYSGQTRGLGIEVDNAQQMLNGGSFYAEVTSQERMEVISVMARGFEGTGHWYYCRNNHPFTIGECGGAMETASCPECGAPVGGENHFLAPGVTRAEDYERNFEQDAERGIEEDFNDMEI